MRKYKLVLPDSIAKEKARLAKLKKEKHEREIEKKKKQRKLKLEREKQRKKEKAAREALKRREHKKELTKRKHERQKVRAAAKREKELEKVRQKRLEEQKWKEEHREEWLAQVEKARVEKIVKTKARKKNKAENEHEYMKAHKTPAEIETHIRFKERLEEKRNARRRNKDKLRKRHAYTKIKKLNYDRKYYRTHGYGKEVRDRRETEIKERTAMGDVYGEYMIAVAQDEKIRKKYIVKNWWNDITEIWNKMVEENHSEVWCPKEELTTARKQGTRPTKKELVLLKKIDPNKEDNITAFRDDNGRIVTVKTDTDELAIVLKEPWYEEEKFAVNNLNPVKDKKTAKWIGENLIEPNLSEYNMRKVILWHNYLLIDGDEDFDFAFGKTENTAVNLYMALFNKYEDTDYVYFIGELHCTQYAKWTQKIKDKTGWERLMKGKGVRKPQVEERTKPIPTKSSSTKSVSGKSSGKR